MFKKWKNLKNCKIKDRSNRKNREIEIGNKGKVETNRKMSKK